MASSSKVSTGVELNCVRDLPESLEAVRTLGVWARGRGARCECQISRAELTTLLHAAPTPSSQAVTAGFEFAAVPLFHPRNRRDVGGLSAAAGAPVLPRDVPATRECGEV
jgi:hypothetical protein